MGKNKTKNKNNILRKKLYANLEMYSNYILKFIENEIDDKEKLLELLKNTELNINEVYISNHHTCDKESTLTFIDSLDDVNFIEFKNIFNRQLQLKNIENANYKKLHDLTKNYDIDIDELCLYNKNSYGIKVYICGSGYLFDYDGTIEKLAKYLITEHDKLANIQIQCRCCNTKITVYSMKDRCKCGAYIINEVTQPNDLTAIMNHLDISSYEKESGWKFWIVNDTELNKIKYIKENKKEYFDDLFEEYINNTEYDYISSDVIVDKQWIINDLILDFNRKDFFDIISKICIKYCEWIENGSLYELSHNSDNLEIIDGRNKFLNIKTFETLNEWLHDCYVGYKLGCFYETYINDVDIYTLICDKINSKITINEEDDRDDYLFEIETEIETFLLDYIQEISNIQCWKDYSEYINK